MLLKISNLGLGNQSFFAGGVCFLGVSHQGLLTLPCESTCHLGAAEALSRSGISQGGLPGKEKEEVVFVLRWFYSSFLKVLQTLKVLIRSFESQLVSS